MDNNVALAAVENGINPTTLNLEFNRRLLDLFSQGCVAVPTDELLHTTVNDCVKKENQKLAYRIAQALATATDQDLASVMRRLAHVPPARDDDIVVRGNKALKAFCKANNIPVFSLKIANDRGIVCTNFSKKVLKKLSEMNMD